MQNSYTTKLPNDLIQIEHRMGFTIVKSVKPLAVIPLFCDVCSLSMNSTLDKLYYEKYRCCSSCGIKWADIDQKKWMSGWRPKKEEIKEEMNRRIDIPVSFSP